MLKLFAVATLGFVVLFGAIGTASAGKRGHFWLETYPSSETYSYSGPSKKYRTRRSQSQPNIELDTETEAVWRNLRPEWFD